MAPHKSERRGIDIAKLLTIFDGSTDPRALTTLEGEYFMLTVPYKGGGELNFWCIGETGWTSGKGLEVSANSVKKKLVKGGVEQTRADNIIDQLLVQPTAFRSTDPTKRDPPEGRIETIWEMTEQGEVGGFAGAYWRPLPALRMIELSSGATMNAYEYVPQIVS